MNYPNQSHLMCYTKMLEWDNGWWNQGLINQCYEEDVARTILSIPLSHRFCEDKLIWSKQTCREYTVKAGYHLAYVIVHRNGGENSTVWKWLWSLKLQHKIKLLAWKCCRGILPVKECLADKIPQIDRRCSICQEEGESITHALLKC
ncbi:zf-RVT domain-containing protein, partial [Cephalotus follicularis]